MILTLGSSALLIVELLERVLVRFDLYSLLFQVISNAKNDFLMRLDFMSNLILFSDVNDLVTLVLTRLLMV